MVNNITRVSTTLCSETKKFANLRVLIVVPERLIMILMTLLSTLSSCALKLLLLILYCQLNVFNGREVIN